MNNGKNRIELPKSVTVGGTLLLLRMVEAFFSTGHAITKQATKSLERKLK